LKRVLGVSLGSPERDFEVSASLLGEEVQIRRIGTDGDAGRFAQLLRQYDGKVDAFGFGGGDLYVWSAGRRYPWRREIALARAARRTPVLDGSGLKNTLERETIRHLSRDGIIDFARRNTLLVSAVDRFGMAEAIAEAGGPFIFGDLIFALNLPIAIRSMRTLDLLARTVLPLLTKCPQSWVYPTGSKQTEIVPKYGKYYAWADTICGDFHFIRRHLPDRVAGKAIVTNTITPKDIALLRERGLRLLVTTTPQLGGRSPGTNILEAAIVAVLGRPPETLTPDDYLRALRDMGWRPEVMMLAER
jgi:hypothetical protein